MDASPSGTWWRGRIAAGLMALLCGAVLFGRVYADFEPVRLKVVRSAIASHDGDVTAAVPPAPALAALRAPIVLIATIRNSGAAPAVITLRIDSAAVRTLTVAPGDRTRFDLELPSSIPVNAGSVITLRAQGGPGGPSGQGGQSGQGAVGDAWSLDYLELANIHGSSSAILRFIIVPASLRDYDSPSFWLAALVCAAVFLLLRIGEGPGARLWPLKLQRVLAPIVGVILAILLASSLVTPFKLLLAPRSFLLLVLLLTIRGLWLACLRARATVHAASWGGKGLFDAVIVALAVALFYTTLMFAFLAPYNGNYSGLVQIGHPFADRMPGLLARPELKESLVIVDGGYDGQFFYAMSFDPFLTAHASNPAKYYDVVDTPPYRYGRIGFSVLTKIASGDRPERYPATMVWLVIAGHFVGALCLAGIFLHFGHSAAWALLWVLVPGFVQSLHSTLPESIAAALLVAGFWAWLRSNLWLSAGLLAASLLVRETGAILLVALIGWELAARRNLRAAATLATGGAAFALWRLYVCWRLFPEFGWKGLFVNAGNLGAPFVGMAGVWSAIAQGAYFPDAPNLAWSGALYPLVLLAAMALAVAMLRTRRTAAAVALAGFCVLAAVMDYGSIWLHVGNAERTSYETILFSIVAFASLDARDARSTRLRAVMLAFFGALACYLLFASVDAAHIRRALGIPFI